MTVTEPTRDRGRGERVVRRSGSTVAVVQAIAATVAGVAGMAWALQALDPGSVWFAFVVVWLPMTWLGTVSRLAQQRLPEGYHRLRPVEQDGRIYELVGVRLAKRLLRRGPLSAFNPGLHLPSEPTPERLRRLEQRMRDAEANHAVLFVLTLGIVAHAAARGWWAAAAWTLLFDVLLNGYPVMLQRYNRALLRRRFGRAPAPTLEGVGRPAKM